jgi:hypothetical protein
VGGLLFVLATASTGIVSRGKAADLWDTAGVMAMIPECRSLSVSRSPVSAGSGMEQIFLVAVGVILLQNM